MVTLLLGPYGHGKSTYIINQIKQDFEHRVRSFLIVPEQQTLASERQLATSLPPSAQLYTEATNFTRLADTVFRKTGGLKYNYVTSGGQNLIMYRAICEVRDLLCYYKNIPVGREKSYIKLFLQAIGELKAYSITAPQLDLALTKLEKNNTEETEILRARIQDILNVWTCYDKLLLEKYDDPYSNLLMLQKKLGECDVLNGCNAYIDSFYGFTKSQLDVVAKIIELSDNVTIALDCPPNATSTSLQYVKIASTRDKILGLCKKLGKEYEIVPFEQDYKHASSELEYISQNIWNFESQPITPRGDVTLALADDEFSECEYVCTKIKELISCGEKYGDIAIIARNSSTYRGIIDFCLDKYQIPYYFSAPSKLSSQPVIKMVVSALNSLSGMRSEDIITYAKCGYTDIDESSLYLLESYIYKWNIYGKKFKNEDYWSGNPDGYVQNPTATQMKELAKILKAREKILQMLSILEKPFSLGLPVKDCASAVFEFLEAHHARKKLLNEIKKENAENAQQLSQVWGALISALDSVVDICGEIKADAGTFLTLLSYAMMDTKIGTIPTGEDNVTIADASLVRAKNIRHVFVLGANEGVFPSVVNDDSFFSDRDKIELETVEINLTPVFSNGEVQECAHMSAKTFERSDDELLFFKNSISVASHSATIISLKSDVNGSIKRPSIGFTRIKDLLGGIAPYDFSKAHTLDKIYTKNMARELLGVCCAELKQAIGDLLDINISNSGFSNDCDTISDETAKAVFGNRLYMSKSKLETFAKCHFNYYCTYVLKLKDNEKISFSYSDIGTYIHAIFEHFLKLDMNSDGKEYSQEEILSIVSSLTDDYVLMVCGTKALSNKMKHFFNRLKHTVSIFVSALLEEKRTQRLKPEMFEISINGDGRDAPLPTEFSIDCQSSVVMTGIADRIDVYREGGKAYIRIVDYKTGSYTFNPKRLDKGLDMQMLIYLLALYNLKECDFKDKLLQNEKEIVPQGIVYLTYKIEKTDAQNECELFSSDAEENEKDTIKNKIARSGMEIDNEMLKSTIDKYNLKEGSLSPYEDFSQVFDLVKCNIERLCLDMLSGNAYAEPLEGETPCDYCKNKAICRKGGANARFN